MRLWLPILMLLPTLLAEADSHADKLVLAGVQEFNAAYQSWDGTRFVAAADLFRRASTNNPGSCVSFYWLGVAEFHCMLHARSLPSTHANRQVAAAAMEGALNALNIAVRLDDRHAESHALLGTIYGMKIEGSVFRAVRFGPRIQAHSRKALANGSENPRVRYLLGTCQLHTAKSASARREALATLLEAEKLFESESRRPGGPSEPRWGASSCCTFIARTYELLGDLLSAAGYYRKALMQHPADHMATEGLGRVTRKEKSKT